MNHIRVLLLLTCTIVPCLAGFDIGDAFKSVFMPDAADEVLPDEVTDGLTYSGADAYTDIRDEMSREDFGCWTPFEWLSHFPGGCPKDKYMNYKTKEACLVRQYFSCDACGEGRYHHKYDGIKSWQLAGDGRQICVQCPK